MIADAITLAGTLGLALVGPVTSTDAAAVAMTNEGRLAYVAAAECRIGMGWLRLSDRKGNGADKVAVSVIGASDGTSTLAADLCRPFRKH